MNPHTPNPRRAQFSNWLGFVAAVAIGSSATTAQEKPAEQPTSANSNETVVLSPFVVTVDKDNGYAATSSLAGSRLNTRLKDIPASISVVTKDMMNDLGVYNSAQLLTYTLGTEVSGASGSFSGAGVAPGSLQQDGPNRSLLPSARIRGLSNADNTRDYFLTSIPWDGFNTDRVDVNRGPNAMLFGTGSPAGIINQTTSKADFDKNKTDLLFNYGSFGSYRVQLDNNTVLIKDRLAVRAALKYSDERFMQEEAFIEDMRLFVAATYKPFELTTIRANFEDGEQSAVKPQWRPPFDNGIESWFKSGKPVVNPLTKAVTLTGIPTARISAVNPDGTYNSQIITGNMGGGWGSDNVTLVFDQPNMVGTSLYGLSGLYAITNRAPGYSGNSMVSMVRSGDYQRAQHAGLVGAGAYNEQEISNPAIFDFYNHLLEGGNKPEDAKWSVFTASVEQLLPNKKGGIELAYSNEDAHWSFANPFNWATYGIAIDINTVLLDGRPNAYLGRPVIASDSWSTETQTTRESMRATAFYKLEMNKGPEWLQKLIGTHTVTANVSSTENYSVTRGGRHLVASPEYVTLNEQVKDHSNGSPYTIPNNAARGVQTLVYLGESAKSASSPVGLFIKPVTVDVLIPGVSSVPVYFYQNVYASVPHSTSVNLGGTWVKSKTGILRGSKFDKSAIDLNWTGGAKLNKVKSQVLILQSSMFSDTILPTLGWRKDELDFYNAPGNLVSADGFSEYKAPLPTSPSSTFSQDSFNWGAVARLPRSMEAKIPYGIQPSLFYNESDNFSPTNQRINIYGQNIDPTQGTTKEYGFVVGAFDDKLSLRVTWFETALERISVDMRDALHSVVRDGIGGALSNISNGNNAANPVASAAFTNWWNTDPLAANIKQTWKFVGNQPTAVLDGVMLQTTNSVAQGNEVELTYNPMKNWRIALNFANVEVVNSDTARDAALWLSQITPALNGTPGQVWTNGSQRTWQTQAQAFVNAVNGKVYGDNQAVNPELRKQRFNLISNYTFTTGVLKNFGVGGSVRWADRILLGTGFKSSPQGDIPDYSVQYYGSQEVTYDAWFSYRRPNVFKNVNLDLQLNIRNIGVDKELIPTVAQPDGSIAQWRIAEPMTVTLSTKFSF